MKKMIGAVFLTATLGLSSCTDYKRSSVTFYKAGQGADEITQRQTNLGGRIDWSDYLNGDGKARYKHEWIYNQPLNDGEKPDVCLAMSGGGVRSAAFNMGSLIGLHNKGVLKHVDVMSSVSGGGYTASWFYAQHIYKKYQMNKGFDVDEFRNELFDKTGAYQRYVAMGANYLVHFHNKERDYKFDNALSAYGEGTLKVLSLLPSIPIKAFTDIAFDWDVNSSPLQTVYQNGLERTFHYHPNWNGVEFKRPFNTTSYFGVDADVKPQYRLYFKKDDHWPNGLYMEDYMKDASLHLPTFIINVNADYQHTFFGKKQPSLKKQNYEFTPFYNGSDGYGYWADYPFDMHSAVAVSGAAIDSAPSDQGVITGLWSVSNAQLGVFISNPNKELSDTYRMTMHMLPFPFYLAHPAEKRTEKGTSIYLSDGGHIENLGLYAALRRGCETVFVIDATRDQSYIFDDLQALNKNLKKEYPGVEIVLDGLDLNKEHEFLNTVRQPILTGKVRNMPVESKLIYIKPFYQKRDDMPSGLKSYIDPDCQVYQKGCGFPQESTMDQFFTMDQYLAYRELGDYIIENYLTDDHLSFLYR